MIGRTLKHYKIESIIGQGGMGIVYKARDIRLERPVALKMIKPDLMSDPDRRSRFLREARSAARLTHPAIARVYDIDEEDGTTFIAMEFIAGRTLSRLIAEGELGLLEEVEIALQIAQGLAEAHEANIIHRDIKSDNIMVTHDGHAKLLDFGLAKLFETSRPEAGNLPAAARTLTMETAHSLAGAVMGTINYMSPEQARGQTLDVRSDIFSMGVVLYEMTTGELPFKGSHPLETMHSIVYEEPKPVTAIRKDLPYHLQRVITRCLQKRREERYPEARALAVDLKHLKHQIETGTGISLPPGERLRGWMETFKKSLPFGRYGTIVVAAALILTVLLMFTELRWGSLLGYAFIGLLGYRFVRNRKFRMLGSFTKKVASLPEVRGIIIQNGHTTIITDQAQEKTYIRITSLLESVNKKLFIGKPLTVEIRDGLADEEFRKAVKQPGVTYIREDNPPRASLQKT